MWFFIYFFLYVFGETVTNVLAANCGTKASLSAYIRQYEDVCCSTLAIIECQQPCRCVAGPRPWWLIGSIPEILSKGQHGAYLDWQKQYGPCFKVFFGAKVAVVVSDPTNFRWFCLCLCPGCWMCTRSSHHSMSGLVWKTGSLKGSILHWFGLFKIVIVMVFIFFYAERWLANLHGVQAWTFWR